MNLSDEAKEFLEKNNIKNYSFNADGTVDVNENVLICTKQNKFPVKFGKVKGYFYCGMINLTSLEGAPSYVGGNFYCDIIN